MCTLPMMEWSTWNRVLYGTHIAYEWSKGNWLAHTYLIINLVDVWQQIHMYVYFFGGRCIMFARES